MAWLNNLKSRLIKNGWGDAIQLLNTFHRQSPLEFEAWKQSGSTIYLIKSCERFRDWAMYRNNKTRPLPFENDVDAIDTCWTKPIKEQTK